jgi:conjugal transfer pilus assembly protein TraV
MTKTSFLSLALLSLTLLGCSATGGDFSCKASAGDSCLTIEQVDAMTRFADGADLRYSPRKRRLKASNEHFSKEALVKQDKGQPIWIAPAKSNKRSATTLYAGQENRSQRSKG